jgi:nucleotide-binding universal stress UspA family protein
MSSLYRNVLVALDHGPLGSAALAVGVQEAQRSRGRLTIIHAVDERPRWWWFSSGLSGAPVLLAPDLARAGALLARARDDVPADIPLCTQMLVERRSVAVQVLRAARGGHHDLLVLGLRSGPARVHWLERCSPIPVAVPIERDLRFTIRLSTRHHV